MRLIVFLITAIAQTVVACSCFLMLLVGLNGYSERQATPGLIFYIVFALITVFGMSFIGGLAARYFLDKNWMGKAVTSIVAIITSSILGAIILVAGMFGAFVIAEALRGIR